MDYRKKLVQYGKKSITKDALARLFSVAEDRELHQIVSELGEMLSPVKASMTNGNLRYPLFLKYRVNLPKENFDTELREISALHPLLQASGYLQKKPEMYRKFREEVRALDRYLFARADKIVPISRKERSFEIFSEEKQLDDRAFCGFLESLGVDERLLGFYDTPEYCFNDFIPERKAEMTLLICENKDIWFNIRRVMFENQASELFGVHLDGVVYGSGNKISQKEALTSYTRFMGDADVEYLYWGDIDRAGLNIYLSLKRNNQQLKIRLFLNAYERMLDLAKNRTIPDSEDHREIMDDYDAIIQGISEENREFLLKELRENKRIPQEIITYRHLREEMQ